MLRAFSAAALPDTIQAPADAQDEDHDEELLARDTEAKRIIADCDQRLSRFRDAGGKVVFWHGTADPLIFFRGSVDYYQRLADATGGARQTKKFARFFVAPGVGHCGGGQGAAPADPLDAVVRWVEHGKAPDTLAGQRTDAAGTVVLTRPVCQYPLVARYTGRGATTDAKSFTCAGG